MQKYSRRYLSWVLGAVIIVLVVWYFQPRDLLPTIRSVSVTDVFLWVTITIVARLIQAETTVAPLRVMGHPIRYGDVFWIGWVRTFANQILPTAGIAAYAQALRSKTKISWSELSVLAAPQYVLVVSALGFVGLLAVASNLDTLHGVALGLFAVYCVAIVLSISATMGGQRFIGWFPKRFALRVESATTALKKFVEHPGLVAKIVVLQSLTLLVRGSRVWLLFAAANLSLDWREVLLIIAIAESSVLIQLTPGSLGVREGAILGGAALAGVPTDIAASVAIVDRLLVIAITMLLTPVAVAVLRSNPGRTPQRRK